MMQANENRDTSAHDAFAFETALLALDRLTASRILTAPGDDGGTLARIDRLVLPALESIGQKWEQGHIALSQVYMSGRICEELVEALLPAAADFVTNGPVIALAVLEDYHLLGKRMVHATLRAGGFAVRDYGRMDVASLVWRVIDDGIDIVMLSTLMLPSALRVAQVRNDLDRAGRGDARIVVGGAPFRLDETLWREVGANAMGRTAADAPAIIARLTGGAA